MRIAKHIQVGVLLLTLFSCTSSVDGGSQVQPPPPSEGVRISLTRSLSPLIPLYTISVDESGRVTFTGDGKLTDKGPLYAQLESGAVRGLALELIAAGYLDITEEQTLAYAQSYDDFQTAALSVQVGPDSNTTTHYYGFVGTPTHELLTALESRVDEVLGTSGWIHAEPAAQNHEAKAPATPRRVSPRPSSL